MELDRLHFVYIFPIWTLGTWALLLIVAWCLVGLKRKVDRLIDKTDECMGKQDAYFGLPKLEGEAVLMRDVEVKRIREDIVRHPITYTEDGSDSCGEEPLP